VSNSLEVHLVSVAQVPSAGDRGHRKPALKPGSFVHDALKEQISESGRVYGVTFQMPKPSKGPAPQNIRAKGFPDLPQLPDLPNQRVENMTVLDVLNQSRSALEAAHSALHKLEEGPTIGKMSNLRQAVVEIRRSTFVLQKLKGRVEKWDEWYGPLQESMKSDPLMRYFSDLRNQIEKEGIPSAIAEIRERDTGRVIADVAVYEDALGISVAGAIRPEVDPQKVSAPESPNLDDSNLELRSFRLIDPPLTHLGYPLKDFRFVVLADLAISYLYERIVQPATKKFT
jgi:hypothetical protein